MKLFTCYLIACLIQKGDSLAYAPNFITKIIVEQTGIAPKGLQHIESVNYHSASQPTDDVVKTPVQVRTRFPPEPNGFLHLGHAKAVSFNFEVARMFNGVCHLRMDDTNPTKEDEEYVRSILADVRWIQGGLYDDEQPWEGPVRKTSDYFDTIYECALALIKSGDAYVDSLSAEEMREYRGTLTEPGMESPYRERSVEDNLKLFKEMRDGKYPDGVHVLRAKIDMASPNINLRDPTLYRIKHEAHQETGEKWCIYPMYDFSHPIADSIEGITHSLCTLEFEDHRPFYEWTIEKLLPTTLIPASPQQIEFSRLNVKNTVLSKRKLIQLVQEGRVSGWDDPRMPTLSGMRRRGVPPSALRLFCERVGISKADSNIDLSVLEDCIRETMDDLCPRAFAVLKPLKVSITNWEGGMENLVADRHPKFSDMGQRTIPFGRNLYIERSDFFDLEGVEGSQAGGKPPIGFKRLVPNGKVRLRYAYVIECNEIVRDPKTQEPIELKCTYIPETRSGVTPEGMKRVKGIIHWVETSSAVMCNVNQYDRLFSKEEPGKESGDFVQDLNPHSLVNLEGVALEPSAARDAYEIPAFQFERSGYFALDSKCTVKGNLVFNRVVTLRDTWKVAKKGAGKRNRGVNRVVGGKKAVVEDARRIALRAATILSVDPHPEANSLLVCSVDCGDKLNSGRFAEPRTAVAGLAGMVDTKKLVGSKVVAVTNLKPAKIRGIESQAMLLAASKGEGGDKKVALLSVPDMVPNGELIQFEGMKPSEPDAMMKSKGALKAWERVKERLRANEQGEAILDQDEMCRMMTSCGPVKTSLSNTVIR